MHIIPWLYSLLQIYWLDILIVFMFILAVIWQVKKGNINTIKRIILNLVVQAEKQFNSKEGRFKFNQVYMSLPVMVRIIFTQQQLSNFIEEAVEDMKNQFSNKDKNIIANSKDI